MKLKITLVAILIVFAFSCKKDATPEAIIGKWRTTEIIFTAALSEPLYIQFIQPDKVQSTFFSACTGYSIDGSTLILKNTGATISQLTYTYSIRQDTLTLHPSDSSTSANSSSDDMTFVKE